MTRPVADQKVRPWVYGLVKYGTTFLSRFSGIRIYGRENIPRTGRLILAGNHSSTLDPFLASLGTARVVHYMAKKELFENKLYAWLMTHGGTFSIDRHSKADIGAIRKALEVLNGEGVLGIFPQGTRGGSEALDGAAYLALKGKAPIVPMCIVKEGPWKIAYGTPIAPEGKVKELTEQVMKAIEALEQDLRLDKLKLGKQR